MNLNEKQKSVSTPHSYPFVLLSSLLYTKNVLFCLPACMPTLSLSLLSLAIHIFSAKALYCKQMHIHVHTEFSKKQHREIFPIHTHACTHTQNIQHTIMMITVKFIESLCITLQWLLPTCLFLSASSTRHWI